MSATVDPVVDLSVPRDVRVLRSDAAAVAAAAAYADLIRGGAVERDRDRRLPHEELRELARTGLLGMRIPARFGGAGVSSATVAEVFRLISAADPAIGQIPQNHIQFVDTIIRYGSAEQQDLFLPQVLAGARLGNALSERGGRTARDWVTRIVRQPDGSHRLDGRKYYSTGALTAQWIPVFAFDEDEQVVMAYVPRDAPGVLVDQDWTAFGQRGTFSGTTVLEDVHVREEWVVRHTLGGDTPSTYGAFGQLMHAAVDVGIARGALDDGAAFLRERARPARESGVERATEDPQLLLLAGVLDAQVRAAEALLTVAGAALDRADAAPDDGTSSPRAASRSRRPRRSAARPPCAWPPRSSTSPAAAPLTGSTASIATGATPAPTPSTTPRGPSTCTWAAASSTGSRRRRERR